MIAKVEELMQNSVKYEAMRAETMLQPGALDRFFSWRKDIGTGALRAKIRAAVGASP